MITVIILLPWQNWESRARPGTRHWVMRTGTGPEKLQTKLLRSCRVDLQREEGWEMLIQGHSPTTGKRGLLPGFSCSLVLEHYAEPVAQQGHVRASLSILMACITVTSLLPPQSQPPAMSGKHGAGQEKPNQ